MESFTKFQGLVSNPVISFMLQWTMILSVVGFVTAASVHWFLCSTSLQLPVSYILFYLVKLVSDTSLTLSKPAKVTWQPLSVFGFAITDDTFFHANVDVFCGLLIISSLYLLQIS